MEDQDTSESSGGIHVARYKLMSPAKLPISRSPCITIPPGLSPTSFLESPVLLTNIKVEPSPTTGSFFKSQPINSVDLSLTANSSFFEFKPHTSISSAGLQVSTSKEVNQVK
ncbi:hypothetical protein L1987_78174 [Smallanthus sonchifolius]|uniref:Uncharacterized protein n=1 Tax=Smallanthus sonchifolius TaxID=185202 RepID=A0ACB8ZGE6_9ASTR|nr:hypothetical protein L1987_78174 [Smallanthus sonchifolius]